MNTQSQASRSIQQPQPSQTTQIQPPQSARYRDSAALSPSNSPAFSKPSSERPSTYVSESSTESAKSSTFTSKALSKTKADEDDGQDQIEALHQEESFSEKDYISSAVREKSTSAKDLYDQGMQAEAGGNFSAAVRHYNGFIRANKRQTSNGTLAAPYHRLALISWKNQKVKEADVYFRYSIKYARGGNITIIAGDYGLFLMEQDKFPQAEAVLRNALIQSPENKRILLYLGRCSARQNKPIEALRYLETVVGEERAYLEVASVYREKGDFESARHMDQKRNEFLARKTQVIYGNARQYAGTPLAPPAVQAVPRPRTANSVAGPAIPFPTFNDPLGFPGQPVPQPTGIAPITVLPPGGWNAVAPERQDPVSVSQMKPAVPTVPESKVYHYPAGAAVPVVYPFSTDSAPGPSPTLTSNPISVTKPETNTFPPMTSEWPTPANDGRFGTNGVPGELYW